jgi:5-methylcytosine-specific restriction endonuclease McrA
MQVLVLSNSYQPLYTCGIEKAIRLLYLGKAVSVKDSDAEVRSPSVIYKVPQAIRLLAKAVFVRIIEQRRPTRQAILKRDAHQCQYCGATKDLTMDHLIPRSKGGQDSWENLVTACYTCNNKKGDKLLQDTSLKLKKSPQALHPMANYADLWNQLMGWEAT